MANVGSSNSIDKPATSDTHIIDFAVLQRRSSGIGLVDYRWFWDLLGDV